MKEIKGLFPLILSLFFVFAATNINFQNLIVDATFSTIDYYFELSDALQYQSLATIVFNKFNKVYCNWQEILFQHMKAAFNAPKSKEKNSDLDKLKSRYNFASINGGAKIIESRPSLKIGKSILDDAVDNYFLYDCHLEPLEITISLTEDVLIDTIMVLNLENHASFFKDFEILISTKFEANEWLSLGIFQTKNKREWQYFRLPQKWARYVRLKLLSHYGGESICTLTQIKVLGVTMLENFRDEFLVKDEMYGNEIMAGAIQMHFKQPPPHHPVYTHLYNDNLTSPNPNQIFSDLINHQNFSLLTVLNDELDSDPDSELDEEPAEVNYHEDKKSPSIASPQSQSINDIQSPSKSNVLQKNYHKSLIGAPQTHRKFKSFSLKLISQLFEIPLKIFQQKGIYETSSHPLVKVSNETQLVTPQSFYDFEYSITMNIMNAMNQGKKADPHESIFKTLTRRIKGLETTIVLLETLFKELNKNHKNQIENLSNKVQDLELKKMSAESMLERANFKNKELEKRLENIEKMTRDISSYGFLLSNITLFTLLYIILTITWKILEKTAFSPVDSQRNITAERNGHKKNLESVTPKSSFAKRPSKLKRPKSPKSGTVFLSTKSWNDFQKSPQGSKSPINF